MIFVLLINTSSGLSSDQLMVEIQKSTDSSCKFIINSAMLVTFEFGEDIGKFLYTILH